MKFLVINLKKYFFTIIFSIFIILLFILSEPILNATKLGLELWAFKILPSLFPFFVATELLLKTNITSILGRTFNKFMKPIFNVPGESSIALILGNISGYPIGAKVVCNLKKCKQISPVEAERLIAYTNNSSPFFILTTVGFSMFYDKKIGQILLFSHIVSSILVGICFKYWKKNYNSIDVSAFSKNKNSTQLISSSNLGEVLNDSIRNATFSILSVGGFIILFSIILEMLNSTGIISVLSQVANLFNIPPDVSKCILTSFIKITNGINLISNLNSFNLNFKLLITSFALGFGGISILLQVYSIISKENISIKPYFYGKLLQGLFSFIITYILI